MTTGSQDEPEPDAGRAQETLATVEQLGTSVGIAFLVLAFNFVWNFAAVSVFGSWPRNYGPWVVFLAGVSYMPLLLRVALKHPRSTGIKSGVVLGCAGALLLNGACWFSGF